MELAKLNYFLRKFKNKRSVCRAMNIHPSTLSYYLGQLKRRKPKTLAQYNRGFKDFMSEIYRIDYTLQDPVKYGQYMRIRFIKEYGIEPNDL